MGGKFLVKLHVLAVLNVVLNQWLRSVGFTKLIKGDEGAMSSGSIALVCGSYAFLIGILLLIIWPQGNDVKNAVLDGDKEKFNKIKDQRVPKTLKSFFMAISIAIVISFQLLYFTNILTAVFSNFISVFITLFAWEVIMDLDDPSTGNGNVKIPDDGSG